MYDLEKKFVGLIAYFTLLMTFTVINYMLGFNNKNFTLNDANSDFFTCFYHTLISQTTIGYGDTYPKSKEAKIINIVHTILSFTTMIIFLT